MSMIPGGGEPIDESALVERDFSLLTPENDIKMQVTDARLKDKDGDGKNITVSAFIEMLDGGQIGRKFWANWTLYKNGQRIEGFWNDFNLLAKAMGRASAFEDVEQMVGTPFVGNVYVAPPSNGFPAKNALAKPRKFDPLGAKPAASGATPSGGAAWRRK